MPINKIPCSPGRSRTWQRSLLGVLLLLSSGCGKVELYSNLEEREANEMMAILLNGGIECSKEEGDEEFTWKLLVGDSNFSQSVKMLKARGYPIHKHERMGKVFQKSGLVSSPTEDRIRYVYALSEELAVTLSRIDGVIDARVHVVLPNNDPYSEHVKPSSAAVYIKHLADADMLASRPKIKGLVAKSIEGLDSENIEVFLDEVEPIAPSLQNSVSYSRVLGVNLDPASVKRFWLLVGGIAAAVAVNLGLGFWFVFRNHVKKTTDKDQSPATNRTPHAAVAT